MIDLSQHSTKAIPCGCPAPQPVVQWDVVDARNRSDLVASAVAGELLALTCSECGHRVGRSDPLGWVVDARQAVTLFVFSDTGGAQQSAAPPGWFRPVWQQLSGDRAAVVVHLDQGDLALVASRDLAEDLGDPSTAVCQVGAEFGLAAAQHYGGLLGHVAEITGQNAGQTSVETIVAELHGVEDLAGLTAFLEVHPEILTDETLEHVDAQARHDSDEGHFRKVHEYLLLARDSPEQAWQFWEQYLLEAAEEHGAPLAAAIERMDELVEQGAWAEVLQFGQTLLDQGIPAIDELEYELRRRMASAWLTLDGHGANKQQAFDEAVIHLERALEIAEGDGLTQVMLDLAVAYGDRISGARRSNLDRAVELAEGAVDRMDDTTADDVRAIAHTNLAWLLRLRQEPDPVADLQESRRQCELALQWRSPEIDADNWAYTQINRGVALAGLADHGHASHDEADAAYEEVITRANQINDSSLVALAYTNLGDIHRRRAASSDEGSAERQRALRDARDAFAQAAALYPAGHVNLGRALRQLGDVHHALGDDETALASFEQARAILTPATDPDEARRACWGAASIYADGRHWPAAADAFADAVLAGEIRLHTSLETRDREQALIELGRLPRWGAYALAQVGRLEEAILVLEDGRTRELRRRLGGGLDEVADLRRLSPELHQEYLDAVAALRSGALDLDSDAVGLALQQIVDRIRRLPALRSFGTGVRFADVTAAVTDDELLVYLNPAPQGTVALVLSREGEQVSVEPLFMPATSRQLFFALALEPGAGGMSYLAALYADDPSEHEFQTAIEYGLGWVGEHLLQPLLTAVAPTSRLAIVPCGPLGVVPMMSCFWEQGSDRIYGIDQATVKVAPSAVVQAACARRASAATSRHLVAIADPSGWDPPLEAARAEVAEINARHFGSTGQVAEGPDATRSFLTGHAGAAGYLHLACHAKADVADIRQSKLFLAGGELSLADLTATSELSCRLAVASACETGRSQVDETADEMLSLGVALIAMGSAGALASLWSVDDYATALLMLKFYDGLGEGQEPADALRLAQLWLRNLTEEEQDRFLDDRPALAAELRRRKQAGRRPGRGGAGAGPSHTYAHPDFWGAFVLYGT